MDTFVPLYLSRADNPIWMARAFLASFFKNDPGSDVPLIFLQKGYRNHASDPALQELPSRARERVHVLWINDEGMDLEAYAKACRLITDYSHLLFMNSNCILKAKNWYELYRNALFETEGRGLIGATGSWEAMSDLGVSFPNPHIRTNAFLVDRKTYLRVYGDPRLDKQACYEFESGVEGLTAHFLNAQRPVLVLGRDGALYTPDEWPESRTFRSGRQDNLVVEDNQTRRFQRMGTRRQKRLAHNVWRGRATLSPVRPFDPILLTFWYDYLYLGYRFRSQHYPTTWGA